MTDVAHSPPSSIERLLFGEHIAPKSPTKATTSSAMTKSPTRSRLAGGGAAAMAHHLSPPGSGAGKGGKKSPSPATSTASSPRLGASMSDAEKMLALMAEEEGADVDGDSTMTTEPVQHQHQKGTKKRKSGERDDASTTTTTTTVATLMAGEEDTGLRAKTAKFIRVTSPSEALAHRVPAGDVGEEVDADKLLNEMQPSQDAYDQEDGAAAAHREESSPEYDYSTQGGAAATATSAPMTPLAQKRAKWSALCASLSSDTLQRAIKRSNHEKELGNQEFTRGRIPHALEHYSTAIGVLEKAFGSADTQPWTELTTREVQHGPSSIQEELDLIRQVTAANGGGSTDLWRDVKMALKNLASVYANRATCHSKAKSNFVALTDVHHVLSLLPLWIKGHTIKASVLAQMRQFSEAIHACETAAALPGVTDEERKKVNEKKQQIQHTASKQERASRSPHASQASTTATAIKPGGPVAAAPAPAVVRSHSTAALTSHTAGASTSKAIELSAASSSSSSLPPRTTTTGGGSESSSAAGVPMVDVPVHPPPSFTPPSSMHRQQSDPQQPGGKGAEEMSLALRPDTPKEELQRREREKRETAKANAIVIKSEPARPKSPALAPIAAGGGGGLHAPLSDASNRLSPIPKQHGAASSTVGAVSPQRPSSGRGPRSPSRPIHDLTKSPPRSGASRQRKSPSKSPARGAPPAQDWYVFPIVTIEGIRDLVGDEVVAEALDLYNNKRIEAVRVVPNEAPGVGGATGGPPKLVGLALKKDAPRARERATPHHPSVHGSKENLTYTVEVRFDELGEGKVKEFSCECRDHDGSTGRHTGAAVAAAAGDPSPPPISSAIGKVWTPCAHVGAVLLILRRKQDEYEKTRRSMQPPPPPMTASERAKKEMWVAPARRQTLLERQKEAALRQELEELPNSTLSSMLAKNHQSKTGTKAVLIARIVENKTLGNLPRCRKCKGTLFYASGAYHCHGSFDQTSKRVLQCDFTADRIERSVWQD